jgi:mono/diheme cytochrome c family protein
MRLPAIRRHWRGVLACVLLAFIAIQLVPYGHGRVNPPVIEEPAWDSPETRALAVRACFDCHSNETSWPLYSRVAPASWMVVHHVEEGRAELNFSEWQRPQKEAREAAEVTSEREMPLGSYLLLHAHARLSAAERERLARGLANTFGTEEHASRR